MNMAEDSGTNIVDYKSEGESGLGVMFSKRLSSVVDYLVEENARSIDTKQQVSSSGDVDEKESEESHDAMLEISSGDGKLIKEKDFEPCDRDNAREVNTVANADQTNVTGSNTKSQNQNLGSFEISRCLNVNEKNVNQNMGDGLLKSCSCSFCRKAAYIISDHHYKDINGRLSALKKSQKEAYNLIQMNCKERPTDSAKVESDLRDQWSSLFLSMDIILADENDRLQKSLLKMKDLREACKIDLERTITETPQDNS